MSDLDIRSSERRAAVGDEEAAARLRRERCRHGQCCAHCDSAVILPDGVRAIMYGVSQWGPGLQGEYDYEWNIIITAQTPESALNVMDQLVALLGCDHPEPMRRQCVTCGAEPGAGCRTKGDRPRKSLHTARCKPAKIPASWTSSLGGVQWSQGITPNQGG